MTGPTSEEQWRWAEALGFEKLWGENAPLRIAERIGVLALIGDEAGVARMKEIAGRYEQMLAARRCDAQ